LKLCSSLYFPLKHVLLLSFCLVITFIRQLTEHGGFWRPSDHSWIKLERIQFVGACNPPTDPGRIPLSHRFLRHAPVLFVDFPSVASLHQIYGKLSLMKKEK
jgi:dynein heavy chain 1